MPRIRTIKPEYWQDEKVGRLSLPARLMFIGMWNFADDCGVVRGHPVFLRSQIFPYDDFTKADVESWIDEIMHQGMISLFSVNSENFYQITNFLKHQVINKPSRILNPKPDQSGNATGTLPDQSGNATGTLPDQSGNATGTLPDQSGNATGTLPDQSGTEREREREREREEVIVLADAEARAHEYSEPQKSDDCPVNQIVAIYHDKCPMLPKVVSWNGTGKKSMVQRWREDKDRQSLEWWEQYFIRVANSDFLTGRIKDFTANLNWLVKAQNVEKIINGAYDNRASPVIPDRLKNNIMAGIEFLQGG